MKDECSSSTSLRRLLLLLAITPFFRLSVFGVRFFLLFVVVFGVDLSETSSRLCPPVNDRIHE